jgi:hypothetical protein
MQEFRRRGYAKKEAAVKRRVASDLICDLSYHIRKVPTLSTIEMFPGCGFARPVKKTFSASVYKSGAKDDGSVVVGGE